MEVEANLMNEIFRQLAYSPDRGCFVWLTEGERWTSRYPRGRAGRVVVGYPHPLGYEMIPVSGFNAPFLAHRLAFVFMTRDWPKGVVDHINRDKTDNRWENLRDTGQSENLRNSRELRSSNTSGFRGVHWHVGDSNWMVRIRAGGRRIYVGSFSNFEDAVKARIEAEKKYWNE